MNPRKKTIVIFVFLVISYLIITPTQASFNFLRKAEKIAAPYIDYDLTEYHFTKQKYENILGYKNNDYYFLYGNKNVWLYGMNGEKLLKWGFNSKRSDLLPNCNLIVIDNNKENKIREVNLAGKPVWSHTVNGFVHHDFEVHKNENITFLYSSTLPKDFPLTNGCKHEEVIADHILEVNKAGEELFKWSFHKYFQSTINRDKCNKSRRKHMAKSGFTNLLDSIHPNGLDILKENRWFKKGYGNFKPGNILVTTHHLNEIFIIEKLTKKIVWSYKGSKDSPLDGPHEAKMIPPGYPGEGNILIFDNGKSKRKYSIIKEINPITKEIVWSYSKPGEFFNKYAGSQQRLKNGDTFISDDTSGRVFIIDKKGKIKWQFSDGNQINQSWLKRAALYEKKTFAHCL